MSDEETFDVTAFLLAAYAAFDFLNGEAIKVKYLGAILAGWAGAYLARRVYRRLVIGHG